MKVLKKYCWLLLLVLVSACYEPLEVNTDNIAKVNMPVRIAMPLMDGNLTIAYDSLVNFDDLGVDLIKFENNKALISIDTMIDFYSQMSSFLNATDVDFNNMTAFSQRFDLRFNDAGASVKIEKIDIGNNKEVDTTLVLHFVDSLRGESNGGINSVYINKNQGANIKIEGFEVDKEMDLGLDFQVYKIAMKKGLLKIKLTPGQYPTVTADSLFVNPSMTFNNGLKDTTLHARIGIPIKSSENKFPLGMAVNLSVSLPDFYQGGVAFDKTYEIHTFDTVLEIPVDGLSYERVSGDGKVSVDVKNWITTDTTLIEGASMFALPGDMKVELKVDSIKFEQVELNYGRDTMFDGSQSMDFDFLDDLSKGLEVEGFSFKQPEVKLKLRSNIGFSARFVVDNLAFKTHAGDEPIMKIDNVGFGVLQPKNPDNINIPVLALEDSLVIDSTTSRIDEIDIFDIKGLALDYAIVLNPGDSAGFDGMHNFIYLYDKAVRDQMYDVKLFAEARIPIAFRFDNIRYEMTQAFSLDSMGMDMIELTESDSVNLNVKLKTRNFPFEFATQFYFGEVDGNGGEMKMLDSLFNLEQIIIPSSYDGVMDSVEWSLTLDADRFESIQAMDSVRLNVRFSMDEKDYFQVEKGVSLEIGYKFSVGESSATINIDE